MNKLLRISPEALLLQGSSQGRNGLIIESKEGIELLTIDRRAKYPDWEAFKKANGNYKIETRDSSEQVSVLKGYPVKHENIKPIENEELPKYSKGGNTIFIAGFWILEFQNGWTLALCPKESTIQSYNSEGPFKNKLEALNRISNLNSQKALDEFRISQDS